MFTFWVDKSSMKITKNCQFWIFFVKLQLVVTQCYQTQTGQNSRKFWVMFKQRAVVENHFFSLTFFEFQRKLAIPNIFLFFLIFNWNPKRNKQSFGNLSNTFQNVSYLISLLWSYLSKEKTLNAFLLFSTFLPQVQLFSLSKQKIYLSFWLWPLKAFQNSLANTKVTNSSFCVSDLHTVFENDRKSLIQPCERSELRLHY